MKKIENEIDGLLAAGRGLSEAEFDKLIDTYFSSKPENEKEKIGESLLTIQLSKLNQIKEIDKEITFLEQLDGIERYLNMAQFSKIYFGKTRSWLYQRLYGWNIHGRPARFTENEKKQFSDALLSLSDHLKIVARELA
ncbi:MAG: DUF5053 domain-containing protein [Dysgonamonadaceae bacterium]|jgi:hypothetical protein|nr:DUF5053 domain-containing protein [Dysgonamonadaceae bacterium]